MDSGRARARAPGVPCCADAAARDASGWRPPELLRDAGKAGTSPVKRQGLPPTRRVRKRRDFQRAYEQGYKVVTPQFALYVCPNGREASRLGVTATRRIGKAAVRNRARRLVREAYRKNQHALPDGYDFVVVVRHKLLAERSADLEPVLLEAAQAGVQGVQA